ncbi:uncharacterized protein LOC135330772 [Halichondria panicea]|uniref:uncharacterized protein LOC135330772 n=1 Tax=Halichondria panicea TaxID=6063 RepID=UPI00312B4727
MATPSRTRTHYRRYLRDASAPIPRSTLLRYKKLASNKSVPNPLQDINLPPASSPALSMPPSSPTPPSSPALSSPLSTPTSSPHSTPTSSPALSTPTSSPALSTPTSSPALSTPSSSPPSSSPLSTPPTHSKLLYPGANVTVFEALCAIMQFCTSFKLSYTAIGALLTLLIFISPEQNLIPPTLYKLKRFFERQTPVHSHKKICMTCDANKEECTCENLHSPTADLVHLNITKSVEAVLSKNSNSLIQLPELSTDDENLSDVWDGAVLREGVISGKFSGGDRLALSMSTDGVPIFKSSTVSMWPVFLVILNLPAIIRTNAENVILSAIWIGPSKPNMKRLLQPLASQIDKLRVFVNTFQGPTRFKASVVLAIFDLPAKAAALCAKQFNGQYGCSVCLHPGKRMPNKTLIYPPDTVYPLRSHTEVVSNATEAEAGQQPVNGILGISPLTSMINLVDSVPVDYMHAVLEGVTRWLTKSWFNSANHEEPYYLGRKSADIDNELLKQTPPHEFSRPPRSIQKHLAYWKASELRTWLLYYSLPLLIDYLPSLFWHHYGLLVCAIHIMLGGRITQDEVNCAEQMLIDFCVLLPELYGDRSCTANAHQILHLAKYVRLWGPLWTHSLFGFENKNGHLKHLFHGKSQIANQLLFNVDVSYTLQLTSVCNPQRKNMTKLSENTYIVGRLVASKLTSEQSLVLCRTGTVQVFFRLFKNGVIFHCRKYSRALTGKRRNTHCCFVSNGAEEFGEIELFIYGTEPCALIRKNIPFSSTLLHMTGNPSRAILSTYMQADLLNNYIVPVDVSTSHSLEVVSLSNILSKAVFVNAFNRSYCVKQPNTLERH